MADLFKLANKMLYLENTHKLVSTNFVTSQQVIFPASASHV